MLYPGTAGTNDIRRYLALLALCVAAYAAYSAGNYLSYVGIAYYLLCAAALVKNHPKAPLMLWTGVGAHIFLTGYALWLWQSEKIIPCHYCLAAAGFVLMAATVMYRLPLVILPAVLIAGVWIAWPWIFEGATQTDSFQAKDEPTVQIQTTGTQPENKPGETEENVPPTATVSETRPEQAEKQNSPEATALTEQTAGAAGSGKTEIQTETTEKITSATPDPAIQPDKAPGTVPAGSTQPEINTGSTSNEKPDKPVVTEKPKSG